MSTQLIHPNFPKAKITKVVDLSYCDETEHFYAGPDRINAYLDGINCEKDTFIDSIISLNEAKNCYGIAPIDGGITDFGGCGFDLVEGNILVILDNQVLSFSPDDLNNIDHECRNYNSASRLKEQAYAGAAAIKERAESSANSAKCDIQGKTLEVIGRLGLEDEFRLVSGEIERSNYFDEVPF